MKIKVYVNFPNSWFSLRNIKVTVDNKFKFEILAQGEHILEFDDEFETLSFKLSYYKCHLNKKDIHIDDTGKGHIALSLNHKNMIQTLWASLQPNYLLVNSYKTFEEYKSNRNAQNNVYHLKSKKTYVTAALISCLILILSVVQQDNSNNHIPFLIGLSSLLTTIIYFNEKKVNLDTYKLRIFSTITLFVLSLFFLENTLGIKTLLILFTIILYMMFSESLKKKELITN
ncbi:hypothetical protein [Avrilella dinanensis]|uniref:hypothetical protein n=1 Tax=Avrilella dinanensis TaxID=2008672 RepID=UPI002409D8E3|nr:hypothetical protein [Avrilella dinanensis]